MLPTTQVFVILYLVNLPLHCLGYLHSITINRSALSKNVYMAVDVDMEAQSNPRLVEGGLSQLLDDGTRKSHSMAENSAFVTGFFKGVSKKETFIELVTSLYFIYETMEKALESSEESRVVALDYPFLRRVGALEKDMEHFYGKNWKNIAVPSPATKKYCEHIKKVGKETPFLLVSHQYTRYLGDLFGGQMMVILIAILQASAMIVYKIELLFSFLSTF